MHVEGEGCRGIEDVHVHVRIEGIHMGIVAKGCRGHACEHRGRG
jgi:hypothetical protein